jgi:hypothetical protein
MGASRAGTWFDRPLKFESSSIDDAVSHSGALGERLEIILTDRLHLWVGVVRIERTFERAKTLEDGEM